MNKALDKMREISANMKSTYLTHLVCHPYINTKIINAQDTNAPIVRKQ